MATKTELLIAKVPLGEKNDTFILDRRDKLAELYENAAKELREDESTKREYLRNLREWIEQNPDIENCLTDDSFLLRFLRVKKFSVPMAEQTLLKYLNFRKKFQHYMFDMNCADPRLNELFSNGYIYVSPVRDSCGRRVVLYDLSKFDTEKFNGIDMGRVTAITYETLLDDDQNQILGINHVANFSGASTAFLSLFPVTEFGYIVKWGEQSVPMRHKDVNIINIPKTVRYIYEMAKALVSQKIQERFTVHDSTQELIQAVGKRCLPLELGGEIPAADMIKWWQGEMATKRQRLLSFDSMKLLSDRGIIRRKNGKTQDDNGSLPGSFRKLELD